MRIKKTKCNWLMALLMLLAIMCTSCHAADDAVSVGDYNQENTAESEELMQAENSKQIESSEQTENDFEATWEFKVELTPYPDRYIIVANDVRMENGEIVLDGQKIYGGDIVIDYRDKALLDAGETMAVYYEGNEMFSVTSKLEQLGHFDAVSYQLSTGMSVNVIPFKDSRMDTAEPKAGEFKLCNISSSEFFLYIDDDFEVRIPGETVIYPYHTYLWDHMGEGKTEEDVEPKTMMEFYTMMTEENKQMIMLYYRIYLEDGKIVKIEQEFSM